LRMIFLDLMRDGVPKTPIKQLGPKIARFRSRRYC